MTETHPNDDYMRHQLMGDSEALAEHVEGGIVPGYLLTGPDRPDRTRPWSVNCPNCGSPDHRTRAQVGSALDSGPCEDLWHGPINWDSDWAERAFCDCHRPDGLHTLGCEWVERRLRAEGREREIRWLASNRFHTPENQPPPDVQDYLERIGPGEDLYADEGTTAKNPPWDQFLKQKQRDLRAAGQSGRSDLSEKISEDGLGAVDCELPGPKPPPDRSFLQFEDRGPTGLGRKRVTDGNGNHVSGPESLSARTWALIAFYLALLNTALVIPAFAMGLITLDHIFGHGA